MRKLLGTRALLLPLLLAGCSFAPAYRQPDANLAPGYAQPAAGSRPEMQRAAEIAWHDYFTDPVVQAWIAAALEHNRDLAQSVARIAQARAQYRIADSARLPSLEATGSAGRARTSAAVTGIGVPITASQFDVGVAVPAFELDFWGRVRNSSESARQSYLATVEAERAFRLSLIGQVASTAIAIRAGEEQIALAERALEARREGLRIADMRLGAGVTSTVDYDQSRLLVTQAETELAELQRITERNRNLLRLLTGGVEPVRPEARQSLMTAGLMRDVGAGLPSDLLQNRPDILAAEHQLRAANADIGVARAAFLPSISLTAAGGFLSTALGSLLNSDSSRWSAGAGLGLPIFDWGRRAANVTLTRARADELVANYQGTAQQAFREVADALVGRQRYAEQIAAQQRAVEAQRRLARTARLRYDNGIAIYLELLDAERSLFAAEQQLLSLRSAELQNEVSLYVALGGGTAAEGR